MFVEVPEPDVSLFDLLDKPEESNIESNFLYYLLNKRMFLYSYIQYSINNDIIRQVYDPIEGESLLG